MSLEWILGLVGGALVALFGGIGWSQVRKHGRALERRDRAEEERDAAEAALRRRDEPLPSHSDMRRRIERLRDQN